jgi:hypothetical protein
MEQCRSCRAVLYTPCELGVSFFEGELLAGGNIVYENAGKEYSFGHQKDTLDYLRTHGLSTQRPPNFEPSRGPVYLVFYICGHIT